MKQKSIQISTELFLNVYKLIYDVQEHDFLDLELVQKIDTQIKEKMEAMIRRTLYTDSKTAPTEEEREQARKKYLEEIGMNPDFIW